MEKGSHKNKVNQMEIFSLTDPDLRKTIRPKKTAVIPVGSVEQHGPHLPVSTDSDIVTEVAKRLSKQGNYLLMPTITTGVSYEHSPYFNLSIKEATLKKVLTDLCESLNSNGIKTIFIINGHHGNHKVIKKVEKTKKPRIFAFSYWHFMSQDFDHAGFAETSLMLAISNKVKMSLAKKGLITDGMTKKEISKIGRLAQKSFPKVTKNGVWGDPTKASKEKGSKMLTEIVKNLQKKCQTCLTGHGSKLHQ